MVAQLKAAQSSVRVVPQPIEAPSYDHEAAAEEGARRLGVLRSQIQELWAVLESDATDKIGFVTQLEAASGYTPAMEELYHKETVRLTDQRP